MAIQIGAKPDSGFDDPIGMLKDCHRRIESFLGILCVVIDRTQGRSLTDEEREAVKAALQYFRTGGQRHTADEEESLFPRLRNLSRRSTGSKMIITRQTICMDRSSGCTQLGLNPAHWERRTRDSCTPRLGDSSNSTPTTSTSRRRSFSLGPAKCWTATPLQQSGLSFDFGGNSLPTIPDPSDQSRCDGFAISLSCNSRRSR